jgi:nucleoside-diphosphate-sugar epimerase
MQSSKKRIFLTGASGYMGRAGLDVLLERSDRFEITTLVPPTERDRQIMQPYLKRGVKVIWGDLTCYQDVLAGVAGADIILHVGGMVSPLADSQPELTMKVNVGAVENIVRAIQAQPEPDRVSLVYIGTVGQTGNRPVPVHWGRIGDPIKISAFDTYSLSKTIAERIVVDSGLRKWVSLRQTGIARLAVTDALDPILFHAPLGGVLEWVTARDSGMLLSNVCEDTVPQNFWGHIYNIGGGWVNRLTNLEYFEKLLRTIGIRSPRQLFEPNWFALKNFHGHWFSDSDRLEAILQFRTQTLDEYLAEAATRVPWYTRLGGTFPQLVRRKFERVARKPGGTINWIAHGINLNIQAFFGSLETWMKIGGWEQLETTRPSNTPTRLDHGYDEQKPGADFTLEDVQEAAHFRGGECLEKDMIKGNWKALLRWRCHAGHQFSASLNLILMGGHWCPVCIANPAAYPILAQHSRFFNQVFMPDQRIG